MDSPIPTGHVRIRTDEEKRIWDLCEAYAHGEFGPDELDWRCLLALRPPEPMTWRDRPTVLRERAAMQAPQVLIGGHGTIVAIPKVAHEATHSQTWTAAAPTDNLPWSAARPSEESKRRFYDRMAEMRKEFGDAEWARLHADLPPKPDEPSRD